jgi:uncharacterized membrane-anchored protein
MKTSAKIAFTLLLLSFCNNPVWAQNSESSASDKIKWQEGPSIGELGNVAKVRIPGGYVFADADDTRVIMEAMHNPPSGHELGFVASSTSNWYLVFEFDEVGFIKDDEKNSLDTDAMLSAIKKGNEAGNRERAKRGWQPINITGWAQAPRYNSVTNNLEWAIKGESEGQPLVNWNTRLLGRGGVMRVTLVASPDSLNEILPNYASLISGFSYKSGHRYAEFRQGDKMAKYGLSALVVGGATAVAAKTGLLKGLWKFLAVGGVGLVALLKKIVFGKKA